MAAIIVFVVLLAALGAAVLLDLTPDSRDREYGLGPVIDRSSLPVAGIPGR